MDISVVVPVYGCKAALPELDRRLHETLDSMNVSYELIYVDDCCPQGSWEVIKQICKTKKDVVGIQLSRNFGQIKAITAGLDQSKGDWVVVMDCDLQDRPEAIPQIYSKALEGYDVVFVERVNRKDSAFKMFVSKCFYHVYDYFTDGTYDPSICNFGISRRAVIDYYCRMRENNRGYTIFIKWLGFKQTSIGVEGDERFEGDSSYNLRKKIRMAFEMITSQSNKPLLIAVNAGFGIAAVALVLILVLLVKKYILHSLAPVGWMSVIASIYLVGGLLMFSIGIVGLYVGNIFTEVKNRPLYVISEKLNSD